MKLFKYLLCSVLIVCGVTVFADVSADAEKLKDEALEILRANASRQASAEQYATCILKLEQAQSLLESNNISTTALAQEVSASLFWAQKFSDVHVQAALNKMKSGSGTPSRPTAPKTMAKPKTTDDPGEAPALLAEAKKAFSASEDFARSHSADDYTVAMRWFQMANEHPGTDYAMKALELARAAQARFAGKSGDTEKLPDTPEMKFIIEGDALAASEKYEEAMAMYKASLKLKESLPGHKHLGRTYFKRAQQMKDVLMPQFEAAETAYRDAAKGAYTVRHLMTGNVRQFNPNYPPLLEAERKQADLNKEASVALNYYNLAESEFRGVLRLSPKQKDLDAAGHIALCWSVRGDASIRARARQQILEFLSDYTPANDLERSLYEYCKTVLDSMTKK